MSFHDPAIANNATEGQGPSKGPAKPTTSHQETTSQQVVLVLGGGIMVLALSGGMLVLALGGGI